MVLTIGDDARIHKQVRFLHGEKNEIRIGDRANFYRGTEIMAPVTIGDDVFINRDAYIRPQTTIGDRVNIGPFVRVVTDTHDIGPHDKRAGAVRHDAITIGDGSWIGASATILGGVTIGAGSIVAAGSIVTSDVPDDVVVAGVPAKVVKKLGK
ncbi:DapH/DapD/GlmU-related protein [Microbacterium sp. G2-8]|uniref:acyltransferase n=1 Tax=Microbacterium sp. G2-8 TaxID=2842454 RepID=UPI001C89F567|nr:DapH/DapD/GlmU-related protein [Microbacterium sp. G2-8]